MRSRSVWLTASSCLVALAAACGGSDHAAREPKIPRDLARELALRSDAVAQRLEAADSCGAAQEAAALQEAVATAIDARRVPAPLQDQLRSAADALAARVGGCVAAPPPPPPAAEDEDNEEHVKPPKDAKREHGHGKKKK